MSVTDLKTDSLAGSKMKRQPQPQLNLAFGLQFSQLYGPNENSSLEQLDRIFLNYLGEQSAPLLSQLRNARQTPGSSLEVSQLLLELAPHLEDFLGKLFGIENEVHALRQAHDELAPLFVAKRKFVQRQAVRGIPVEEALNLNEIEVTQALAPFLPNAWGELEFAKQAISWLAVPTDAPNYAHIQDAIEAGKRYAAWAVYTSAGRKKHGSGVLFKTPNGVDPEHLVPHLAKASAGHGPNKISIVHFEPKHLRRRDGFALTDPGTSLAGALDQANYCIWCHTQGRDSCRIGLQLKPKEAQQGKEAFKTSAHGVTLGGCPLEERISEFQKLKAQAVPIGALAVICVDNPMAAATGHRICNDCMKSCIYQKQEAVNIPEVETRTLRDVLALPWGFEIYALLTRWNPLNLERPFPKQPTNKRALVVGMGPAGFTLAHHLMNDGHDVVGIDGLKIEPLPQALMEPIYSVEQLQEDLDKRVLAGFGGVAEYGITVRWDKNFLQMIRLMLERREQFKLFGGVRFGGTLTAKEAFELGFDHIALAIGAGKPTTLEIPNGLARGVRVASDFLMALQLTGAAKENALANLQVRLPIVVIGGGLTAIDTATESLAYYVVQVEKFLKRYESHAGPAWLEQLTAEDRTIAQEFIAHASAIRAERALAQQEQRAPKVIELLRAWGGATIAYRKRLIDAPSYTLNHEEVEKALEEGISFAQNLTPIRVDTDGFGAAEFLVVESAQATQSQLENVTPINFPSTNTAGGELVKLAARSIFIAAGTSPNTVLAREDARTFQLDGKYFQAIDEFGNPVAVEHAIAKPNAVQILTHRTADQRYISFFGDVHPTFFGNVVKAMASAKRGYPVVSRVLGQIAPSSSLSRANFFKQLHEGLSATVHAVRRLTPTIVEVVVKAPWAAKAFLPGQFYRLQNFETLAQTKHGYPMLMEGLALTGAWVDKEQGLLGTIVLEMGGSSDLCIALKPGEPIVLMGPTGEPTYIPKNETVLLVGGGLGNAVLFSIGAALRAAGCTVIYFAGYKKLIDRYKVADIEAAADIVVWCSDEAPGFAANPQRPNDKTFVGNIVQAIEQFASERLGSLEPAYKLNQVQRIIAIGSDRMMAAVARARHSVLAPYLSKEHVAIGSINSPMQCMMKEICGQCLQQHIDPITGKVTTVFSCSSQDQRLDQVDWEGLNARLTQNRVSEALTRIVLTPLLKSP